MRIFSLNLIKFLAFIFIFHVAGVGVCGASMTEPTDKEMEVFELDIYQLMQMEVTVTSPAKKPQKLHRSASAIYVLTQEDIRRSGAVNIMEALRLVPGVLVSKINQNRYAISIRGFNRRFGSDKLLVLMDGRTIYSPIAAGVFWIGQDTVLEDIDRIEVIRGPGAALWGSNAVAGVINIITKDSSKTKGTLASGGIGTEEEGFATLRYGDIVDESLNYRVYGKFRNRDDGIQSDGTKAFDDKKMHQFGFRSDWQVSTKDNITTQGDYYDLDFEADLPSRFVSLETGSTPLFAFYQYTGANFLSRWTRNLGKDSTLKFQAYYDYFERKANVPLENRADQIDLELQHSFKYGERHDLNWGLNYRVAYFDFETNNIFSLENQSRNLFGFFIHDEVTIVPDKWSLIFGTKLEHNDFTGLEIQPNARILWTPNDNHTIWAAFSRAVRIPTVNESERTANRILIPGVDGGLPILSFEDNQGVTDPEVLISYEMGYRYNINSRFYLDFTGFYFDYNEVLEFTVGSATFQSGSIPHILSPISHDNAIEAEIYGGELAVQWQLLKNLRLAAGYAIAKIDVRPTLPNTLIPAQFNGEGDLEAEGEPEHIFNARSYLNLPYNLQLDSLFFFVSRNTTNRPVPSYTRFDLRLGWKPSDNSEFSLVGQNLFDPSHPELKELIENSSETQRSFYGKATFRFY
jgi:iron complex outermembrane receptor protein